MSYSAYVLQRAAWYTYVNNATRRGPVLHVATEDLLSGPDAVMTNVLQFILQ
jgi:hypothetical protein